MISEAVVRAQPIHAFIPALLSRQNKASIYVRDYGVDGMDMTVLKTLIEDHWPVEIKFEQRGYYYICSLNWRLWTLRETIVRQLRQSQFLQQMLLTSSKMLSTPERNVLRRQLNTKPYLFTREEFDAPSCSCGRDQCCCQEDNLDYTGEHSTFYM